MEGANIIQQNFHPDFLLSFEQKGDTIYCYAHNGVCLRVQVITDHVFRFTYATDGFFEADFSYAIDEGYSRGYNEISIDEKKDALWIKTPKMSCKIERSGLRKSIYNQEGQLLNQDELGFHWEPHPEYGGNIVKMTKRALSGEHFYGLGDKPVQFNLRDKRFTIWGTDEYGYHKDTDPLYKNIPFYIGMHQRLCYGIFFDNTFKSFFDFASERKSVTSFWAQGGELNYYFIYGSNPLKVAERYTRLTGRPELPPLWALGYHQCKWSYYPESEVRQVTQEFRKRAIPCDAIYLDIDYMDGFRCFTWDQEKFPEPKKMVADLAEDGFKTIVIIDPGIKVDLEYDVFKEGFEKGYFCKRADGPYMKGKVWPGECYFPDFTNPEVRKWWAGLFQELIDDVGIKGVWNDMNEPAIFETPSKTFPDDVRHNYDGHFCSHRKAHNIYGMQMSRATYEGVKQSSYPNRPFIITRSTYSGGQRFSSVWTGDNIASWEHLHIANLQCQRLAISGFSFAGSDIGGFIEHPNSELYIRWVQLATFHPFMRTHSSGDHGNQEPWSFGEDALSIVRSFINLRYQLLPYLYTTFYQYVKRGTPMLKPISFLDIHDPDTYYREDEFMIGDRLLVCPVLQAGAEGRRVYLPEGPWYSLWDDSLVEGKKEIWVKCGLHQIPLFVKPGSVIPMYPIQQYVGEKKITQLDVHVYYTSGREENFLYEDRGDGYDYKRGYFNEKVFKVDGQSDQIRILQHRSGEYQPSYDSYRIILHGLPFVPSTITIDETKSSFEDVQSEESKSYIVVSERFKEITIK